VLMHTFAIDVKPDDCDSQYSIHVPPWLWSNAGEVSFELYGAVATHGRHILRHLEVGVSATVGDYVWSMWSMVSARRLFSNPRPRRSVIH
jgi:ABC-type antimicrobial peptide transport system permease subunit